jgi:DNA-directed RNA polymerase subunit RPC12/RpoP
MKVKFYCQTCKKLLPEPRFDQDRLPKKFIGLKCPDCGEVVCDENMYLTSKKMAAYGKLINKELFRK